MFCRMNELTRTIQVLIFVRLPWFRKEKTEHEIRKLDVSFPRRKKSWVGAYLVGPLRVILSNLDLSLLI